MHFVPVLAGISKPLQGDSCTNPESEVIGQDMLKKIKDLMGNTPCSEVKWSKSFFLFFCVFGCFDASKVNA